MPMLLVAFSVVVSSVSSVSSVVSWVVFQCFHRFSSLYIPLGWRSPVASPPQEAQAVVDLDVAFRQLSRSQAGPRVVICCYMLLLYMICCYHMLSKKTPEVSLLQHIYIYFRRGSWPQFIKISCWHQQSSLFMWVLWLYDRLCMLYGYVSSIYHDITIFVAFKSHQDCGPEHQLLQKLRKVRVFVVIKKSYCLMFLKWNPMVDISECMG